MSLRAIFNLCTVLTCVPVVCKVVHAIRPRPVREQHALVSGALLHAYAQVLRRGAQGDNHGVLGDVAVQGLRHAGQPPRKKLVKGILAACTSTSMFWTQTCSCPARVCLLLEMALQLHAVSG